MVALLVGVTSIFKGLNMIKVSIPSATVRTMEGIGKASGKPYKLAFQDAYFHTIDRDGVPAPFPQKVEIFAPKDPNGNPQPYQPGEYQLSPSSVHVGRDGKLGIEPLLIPLRPATSATPRTA